MAGPLAGIRVVELAGLGPAPFAGMVLADMGADVVRIDRPAAPTRRRPDPLNRGRRSIIVDLKHPTGPAVVRRLCRTSDALIEGLRPGVTERLGVGPDDCLAENPALVYGRMTGWGQDGPYASMAGHDINYISLSGALAAIGSTNGPPVPPLNLVGDFGGGGMLLAFGVVCAVLEAKSSGTGQVIDVSMVDGAALLMTMMYGSFANSDWRLERGTNRLDGGAPFYGVYECADGRHVSVGPIEPQFFDELVTRIGADRQLLDRQLDRASWSTDREVLGEIFRTRTRDEWADLLDGTDACVVPVLDMGEVATHGHNVARGTFFERDGAVYPAPAPRFSRTAPEPGADHRPGCATRDVLAAGGFAEEEIDELLAAGAVVETEEGKAG